MTDSKLVLLDPEQIEIILLALGFFTEEYAETDDVPIANAIRDRLTR